MIHAKIHKYLRINLTKTVREREREREYMWWEAHKTHHQNALTQSITRKNKWERERDNNHIFGRWEK